MTASVLSQHTAWSASIDPKRIRAPYLDRTEQVTGLGGIYPSIVRQPTIRRGRPRLERQVNPGGITMSDLSPLVSVIIPTYNCARYIAKAVDSVLAQTYPSVEIIVIDDGSTDDTLEVLSRYYGRITTISQSNQGQAAARNAGLAAAKGKYLALLDADDTWLPQRLACLVPLLENGACDLATSNARYVNDDGEPLGLYYPLSFRSPTVGQYERELWQNEIFGMAVAPTSLFRLHQFDEGMRGGPEDWDIWLRMLRDGAIKLDP